MSNVLSDESGLRDLVIAEFEKTEEEEFWSNDDVEVNEEK